MGQAWGRGHSLQDSPNLPVCWRRKSLFAQTLKGFTCPRVQTQLKSGKNRGQHEKGKPCFVTLNGHLCPVAPCGAAIHLQPLP